MLAATITMRITTSVIVILATMLASTHASLAVHNIVSIHITQSLYPNKPKASI